MRLARPTSTKIQCACNTDEQALISTLRLGMKKRRTNAGFPATRRGWHWPLVRRLRTGAGVMERQ